MEPLNKKTKTFFEVMDGASKSDDPDQFLKSAIEEDPRLVTIFGWAMNPNYKCPLPPGEPPFNKNTVPSPDLAEIQLMHLAPKLHVLYNPNSTTRKKEEIIIDWLERMCLDETRLLIAIKDRTLHKQFKGVTEKTIVTALGWDWQQYQAQKKAAK